MSEKITFAQLVEELSDEMIIPKTQSQDFINALVHVLLQDINAEGKAALTNFGSFKIVQVSERAGVNPKTGEEITIAAHNRLSFTPYKALEKTVNRDFTHLEVKVLTPPKTKHEPETEPMIEAIIPKAMPEEKEAMPNDVFEDTTSVVEPTNPVETKEQEAPPETNTETIGIPELPEKNKSGVSATMILSVVAVVVLAIIAVWFFVFRDGDTPKLAASPEISTPTTVPEMEDQAIPMMQDEEQVGGMTNTPESQVIPMMDTSTNFVDNPAETMTLASQPQENQPEITITFSVSSGVWIYEIARQTYGNTRLWPLIFQANFTLDNNPDKILPNVNLNIPRLEGTTENPTAADYARLAQAARYVADAYEFAQNEPQATAYRKAADWYETLK